MGEVVGVVVIWGNGVSMWQVMLWWGVRVLTWLLAEQFLDWVCIVVVVRFQPLAASFNGIVSCYYGLSPGCPGDYQYYYRLNDNLAGL